MKLIERPDRPICDFCDQEAEYDLPVRGVTGWAFMCNTCMPIRSCPLRRYIGFRFKKPKKKVEVGLGSNQIHPLSVGAVVLSQTTTAVVEKPEPRPICEIAKDISKAWKNVYFGAVPYLSAMLALDSVNDNYGMDSGRSIVAYFLSNAQSFRGPEARKLKAELKALIK
jgi:hypothetical protein